MYLKRLKDLREDFNKKQYEIAPYINSKKSKKDMPKN